MIQEIRIWAEIVGIRTRGLVRSLIQVCGLALLAIGIYNMFVTGLIETPVVAPYRQWGLVFAENGGGYYIGDVLIMAGGAILAWFA